MMADRQSVIATAKQSGTIVGSNFHHGADRNGQRGRPSPCSHASKRLREAAAIMEERKRGSVAKQGKPLNCERCKCRVVYCRCFAEPARKHRRPFGVARGTTSSPTTQHIIITIFVGIYSQIAVGICRQGVELYGSIVLGITAVLIVYASIIVDIHSISEHPFSYLHFLSNAARHGRSSNPLMRLSSLLLARPAVHN